MNIKKSSILTIISVLSCTIAFVDCAHADKCDAPGWYMYDTATNDWCMTCPVGCYCPFNPEKSNVKRDKQWLTCGPNLRDYGVHYCGDGWTTEDRSGCKSANGSHSYCQGAKSSSDCYFKAKDTGKAVYKDAISISCNPGTYVKAGYANCQTCPTGYICPGKDYTFMDKKEWNIRKANMPLPLKRDPNSDSGIYLCPSGTVANSNHTDCVAPAQPAKVTPSKITCKAGTYLPIGKTNATDCKSCLDGYICPGGTWSPDQHSAQGLNRCGTGMVPNSTKTKCEKEAKKPTKKPKPTQQTQSQVSCKAGTYLPMSKNSCDSCLSGYYCPGGKWTPDPSMNQGLKTCAAGMVPNSSKTACETKITCAAGTYLPMGKKACDSCLDGYYCAGGKWTPDPSMNQGLAKCASGFMPDSTKSKCVNVTDQSFDCEPGFFLPAKSSECKRCSTTKNYCPGGTFLYAEYDQGMYNCPYTSVANSDRSSCIMTLTKDYMKYGPNGSNTGLSEQCWTQKTPEEYAYCIFSEKTGKSNTAAIKKIAPLKKQNLRSVPGDAKEEKITTVRK